MNFIKIIWYLIAILIIDLLFGHNAAYWFVLLIFFSVVILNASKIKEVI